MCHVKGLRSCVELAGVNSRIVVKSPLARPKPVRSVRQGFASGLLVPCDLLQESGLANCTVCGRASSRAHADGSQA